MAPFETKIKTDIPKFQHVDFGCFGLILTYPEAALDGTINIRSGTKRQIDAPSDRPLEHQNGTRNQIEKIDQTSDRQILRDWPAGVS